MLVIGRKPGETILLPLQQLAIRVVSIRGNCVRLGFTAPDSVGIQRTEVARQIHYELEQNHEASSCPGADPGCNA